MKAAYDGEQRAVREMRPHLAWYLKGTPYAALSRKERITSTTQGQAERLLNDLL